MIIYVDIDNTICLTNKDEYDKSKPLYDNIKKINKLYDEGNKITYYTARGSTTKIDWFDLTKKQLDDWGCKYNEISVGEKPHYDLLICDKTKRIEEI
jgi:Leucine-rich repeat (LRR) protein|tara:strand:+ start:39 stop:329 length:291 start_codon:yes stop_codon:yes gene_type:complete